MPALNLGSDRRSLARCVSWKSGRDRFWLADCKQQSGGTCDECADSIYDRYKRQDRQLVGPGFRCRAIAGMVLCRQVVKLTGVISSQDPDVAI